MKNFNLPKLLLSYGVIIFLIIYCLPVNAQKIVAKKAPLGTEKNKMSKPRSASKVPSTLITLNKEYQSFISGRSMAAVTFKPSNTYLKVSDGYVIVDAIANGDTEKLLADLKALGMKDQASYLRTISGRLPVTAIDKLSALKSLRFVRPSYRMTNAGSVNSQGDLAQRSDRARSRFKVTGAGTKIGILSDSYDAYEEASKGVKSGDLPGVGNPNGYTTPVEVLDDYFEVDATDEGRGMAEIIHDVAPGAKLAFHSAFKGQAHFAQGIIDLKDAGCDLIVDDVVYYAEPYFQDGIIAQAVDEVTSKGVSYFSSAGNNARASYESAYKPSGSTYIFGQAHSFGPNDELQQIIIPRFGSVLIILQWDDAWYSLNGGDGAKTDIDLHLMDDNGLTPVASSYETNTGGDPIEAIEFTNIGLTDTFNILIEKYDDPDSDPTPNPRKIKYMYYGDFTVLEYDTKSSTIFGHSNAAGAISVGAARYNFTPRYGAASPVLEPFSSAGGTTIFYDTNGNPVNEVRQKPTFTAPDGGNTSFFYPGDDYEDDGFPNFFGTSASAPHAAAAAALLKEASGYSLTTAQIVTALQKTAIDMNDPLSPGFDTGYDYGTGSGLIQADAAIESFYQGQKVVSFTLVNADTGEDIKTIADGENIILALLPTQNLNIRANTSPWKVGSVVFDLNGKIVKENTLPYALGGDSHTVFPIQYKPLSPALEAGKYILSATPYTLAQGNGDAGAKLTVDFTVTEGIEVLSFTLLNADTDRDYFNILDGYSIDIYGITKLNIRANTSSDQTGSVVFNFNGKIVKESKWPYALGGDYGGGDYKALDPPLEPGEYTLSAVAYTGPNGTGVAGKEFLVNFEITDTSPAIAARKDFSFKAECKTLTSAYPNPSSGRFNIKLGGASEKPVDIRVYNTKGEQVRSYQGAGIAEKEVDLTGLPSGLYLVKIGGRGKIQTLKLIKQ